jgi:carotenoid 1,2-hydratase
VATYGPGGRFTMTDRGEGALRQTASRFEVGPSSLRWQGDRLIIDIDEWAAPPLPGRVRGQITLEPEALTQVELPLTEDGAHIWRPFAPRARIYVDLDKPGWQWTGEGYFDANFGTRALEEDFSYWTWSRFPTARGATCIYDAHRCDGSVLNAAFAFDKTGAARVIDAPPKSRMARPLWMVRRDTRADDGYTPKQVRPMLDAPFYNRCVMRTKLHGEEVTGVYEALDLVRFRQPWLKPMIALRVPRRPNWTFKD